MVIVDFKSTISTFYLSQGIVWNIFYCSMKIPKAMPILSLTISENAKSASLKVVWSDWFIVIVDLKLTLSYLLTVMGNFYKIFYCLIEIPMAMPIFESLKIENATPASLKVVWSEIIFFRWLLLCFGKQRKIAICGGWNCSKLVLGNRIWNLYWLQFVESRYNWFYQVMLYIIISFAQPCPPPSLFCRSGSDMKEMVDSPPPLPKDREYVWVARWIAWRSDGRGKLAIRIRQFRQGALFC